MPTIPKMDTPEFENWKQEIEYGHGTNVCYRTTGANGWGSLEIDENGKPSLAPTSGPCYTDAHPVRGSLKSACKLIGSFNHHLNKGTIFYPIDPTIYTEDDFSHAD